MTLRTTCLALTERSCFWLEDDVAVIPVYDDIVVNELW